MQAWVPTRPPKAAHKRGKTGGIRRARPFFVASPVAPLTTRRARSLLKDRASEEFERESVLNRPFYVLNSLFFVAALALVSACQDDLRYHGGDDWDYSEPSGPVSVAQREAKALAVHLTVYPGKTEAAPRENGQSPFGAMVGYPSYGTINYCSVAHLKTRKVALAAHCLRSYAAATDFYFIFFDRAGKKRITQGKKILYKGDPSKDDIAIVQTDDRADAWDTLNGFVEDTSPHTRENLGDTILAVTLWAFDPEYVAGERSMSFRPRHCSLFRPYPKSVYVADDGTELHIDVASNYPRENTMFMDDCSGETISGNSGALITAKGDLRKLYGVFNGTSGTKDGWRTYYKELRYTGSDGVLKIITNAGSQTVFEYGTPFENITGKGTGAF